MVLLDKMVVFSFSGNKELDSLNFNYNKKSKEFYRSRKEAETF